MVSTADRRTALLETFHRLQTAIDARDWDVVAATFLPDAKGYGARGVEAILATMQAHLGGCGPTQHLVGNCVVDFDEDGATVRSAARVHHVGAGPKEGSFFECLGDYTDQWVATPAGWRLRRRHFDMRITLGDFGVLRPAD
jgi:hypothetical protein